MSFRSSVFRAGRFFGSAARPQAPRAAELPSYQVAASIIAASGATTMSALRTKPRLGKIAAWYLPSMLAVAVGLSLLPQTFSHTPSKRTVTLDQATHRIVYNIAQQLEHHNLGSQEELTQEERNQAMMISYGDRSSLEDMERAMAGYVADVTRPAGRRERNLHLEEAYASRSSIKHLRRAMEIYEVQ